MLNESPATQGRLIALLWPSSVRNNSQLLDEGYGVVRCNRNPVITGFHNAVNDLYALAGMSFVGGPMVHWVETDRQGFGEEPPSDDMPAAQRSGDLMSTAGGWLGRGSRLNVG